MLHEYDFVLLISKLKVQLCAVVDLTRGVKDKKKKGHDRWNLHTRPEMYHQKRLSRLRNRRRISRHFRLSTHGCHIFIHTSLYRVGGDELCIQPD